jgi:hypothetical protein
MLIIIKRRRKMRKINPASRGHGLGQPSSMGEAKKIITR